MTSSTARLTLVLGLLLAGTGAASAQMSGSTSNGLQSGAPALVAPTGDPALVDPSAMEPVPTMVIPAPQVPVTPQASCVTRQCGLPTTSAPIIETLPSTTSRMTAPRTMARVR
ncbi:MAG: hypothetical protein K0R27_3886 [Xanthobacteraceae bacterium]|jgi:hypothetical protein|nr:hypothetical protein [Xanthobacteraceae bacterium]